jgi:two-component system, OmpR family, sensor histidine kinase MprB
MITTSLGGGRGAMQVAQLLEENEQVLARLRLRLLVATVVVVALRGRVGLRARRARLSGRCPTWSTTP